MGKKPAKVIKLDPKNIQHIEFLAGRGLTSQEMAVMFEISKKTFERMCKRQPGIKDALERGRDRAKGTVKGVFYEMASSGKHIAATIFYLKTQCGYRETNVVQHDVAEGGLLQQYMDMTPAKLAEVIKKNQAMLDQMVASKSTGEESEE